MIASRINKLMIRKAKLSPQHNKAEIKAIRAKISKLRAAARMLAGAGEVDIKKAKAEDKAAQAAYVKSLQADITK